MRFIGYGKLRGIKVGWSVDVDLTDEIRQALHPHDPAVLSVGRLRRPFLAPSKGPADGVKHDKGALVFAYANEEYLFIEAHIE